MEKEKDLPEIVLEQPVKETDKPETNFTELDYLKELYLLSLAQQKRDKKKLLAIRLSTVFMFVIAAAIVVALIGAKPYVEQIVGDINDITAQIMKIDVKKLTEDVDTLIVEANSSLTSVGDAADTLAALDMDSLNGAIGELTKTVENFGKIDIGKLNDSITVLSDAANALASIKILGKPLLG